MYRLIKKFTIAKSWRDVTGAMLLCRFANCQDKARHYITFRG